MNRFLTNRFAVLSGLLCLGATSQATFLNFDDGQPNGNAVGGYYAGSGVTFSDAAWTDNFGLAGSSGAQGIASISSGFTPGPSSPIVATFSGATSFVMLRGIDVGQAGYKITAWDATTGGNLVDSDAAFGTGLGIGEYYDLWVTGSILRVEFYQVTPGSGGDGMLWDGMEFGPVPEPGSILALGLGVAAFARRRSAKK
ncbi:MAG: PEP-CTERM sorting domain-containing protein [Armatimonadetes bacterium]|nr:PEP-CTERM sorting domain-containing protein [Armatimonadota bacterium]